MFVLVYEEFDLKDVNDDIKNNKFFSKMWVRKLRFFLVGVRLDII